MIKISAIGSTPTDHSRLDTGQNPQISTEDQSKLVQFQVYRHLFIQVNIIERETILLKQNVDFLLHMQGNQASSAHEAIVSDNSSLQPVQSFMTATNTTSSCNNGRTAGPIVNITFLSEIDHKLTP